MKLRTFLVLILGALAGCASKETQIKEALQQNPQLVFDVIEENPEKFIEVVNRAAQKAQQLRYEKQRAEERNEQEKDLTHPKTPKLDPARRLAGTDAGKIVLVEYADFQCPACGMAYQALKQFKEKHKGEIQFYYKNMPLDFHKMAQPAALHFEALFQQDPVKAARFYDLVFENQRQLTDEQFLKKTARHLGADMARLEKDLKSDAVRDRIQADQDEFQAFNFTGTPVVILNGVALNGAQPLEELERIARLTANR